MVSKEIGLKSEAQEGEEFLEFVAPKRSSQQQRSLNYSSMVSELDMSLFD